MIFLIAFIILWIILGFTWALIVSGIFVLIALAIFIYGLYKFNPRRPEYYNDDHTCGLKVIHTPYLHCRTA